MTVTVPSTLPRSTLTPAGLQHKFMQGRISTEPYMMPLANFSGLGAHVQQGPSLPMLPGVDWSNARATPFLSGLGCLVYAEDGVTCLVDDSGGSTGGDTGATCGPLASGYVPCGGGGGGDPLPDLTTFNSAATWASGSSGQGSGMVIPDGSGDIFLPDGKGGGTEISPSGMTYHWSTLPPSLGGSGSSATTITSSQAQAYASIINSLANAGVRIAAITSLPAGASLLPNGTIVGAGQTYNPGSGGINPTLGSLLSSPVLLLGAGALIIGIMAMR